MKRLSVIFCIIASASFAADVKEVKVKALDGFGGDVGSVLSRCQTKAGTAYDPVTVTRDVNSLKDSGEFEDISADAQIGESGVEVVFLVKRKLRYQAPMTVEGAEFFSESKIAKEAGLKDGYLYGEADFAAAAARVRDAYNKKYFADAKVTPVTETVSGNDCRLKLVVFEGDRRKIRGFAYVGNDNVEAGDIDDAIGNFPWWNPMGWFSDNLVTESQLEQARAKIADLFRDRGYLDVKVSAPERIDDGDGGIVVRYTVTEGVRYTVASVKIAGLTRYPEEAVAAKSDLPEPGAVAGRKALDDAAHRITVAVGSGDSGLADTRVEVKRIPSADDPSKLDIVFAVTEGVPVVINEVKIRGNDYTMDKVIRREIALGPGDRMLADRAERSQKRLENLNYFSRVRYSLETRDGAKDASGAEYRDLVYEVEEKNTGSFMVGVGASSIDSVYLSAEVSQANFDLFAPSKLFRGAGQKGRLYVAWGPRYQSLEASVTEPYFLDRMLELTVDGYRRQRWYDEYDLIRSGASASLSYPVKFWPTWAPFGRLGFRLSGELIEFDDVDDGRFFYNGKGVSFHEEDRLYGDAFEPVLRAFWVKDSRDNFRMPTSGHRTQLFADLAPGGDNEYWRVGVHHRSYFKTWDKFDHVFMVGLRAETIDGLSDEVPIYNRMFLGGPKSIRGIEYRHVSPFATRNADGSGEAVPWGGQTLFCMNFEYTVPIVKMLRVAAFSDMGSVGPDEFDCDFSDTFAWTVGIGFRIDIPMFPIRLDFATPIEEPDHAEKEVFSFTVGYDF